MQLLRRLPPLLCLLLGAALARPADAAQSMRVIETRHYRIHTDLDPELSADLAKRLDAMYEAYAWRLRLFESKQELPRFEVYLFRNRKDYLKLTGQRMKQTGGVFMSGRNLLASFLEDQGRDTLRRTLQHEAFHQFAHLVISPDLPVWLNEGLAQVFEEAVWNGTNFTLEQVPPRRVRQLNDDLKNRRLVRFDVLMHMSPEEWARRLQEDRGEGALQYNQSWAMVYFLINATDEHGGLRYRQRLLEMLKRLHDRENPVAAFEAAFGNNIDGFQKRFVEFARGMKPTGQATLMENQEVLADLLVELKRRGKTFDSIAALCEDAVQGRYRITYTRGSMTWSTDADVTTYFRDNAGHAFSGDELFFQARPDAPLQDLICRYSDAVQFRTRFYREGSKVEHEVLVEPAGRATPLAGTSSEQ